MGEWFAVGGEGGGEPARGEEGFGLWVDEGIAGYAPVGGVSV